MEINRVKIGNIVIGPGYPIAVQTMWKEPLSGNTDKVVKQLSDLKESGTDIIRFAVPDEEAADNLIKIALDSPIPVVADIHFDYKLALKCIMGGIHKIRINPGNIGASWKVEEVVKAASEENIPIRVGVNGGSLPVSLRKENDISKAMILAAEMEMNAFEKLSFKNVVFSLKSSDIETTVMANRLFAAEYSYPLHLGVTEAGPLVPGTVKNTIAMYRLLKDGIGSTIRVSLSDSMLNEVKAAREILKASGRKVEGVNIVSCPRCGRASFDTHKFLKETDKFIQQTKKDITVAVMGCIVNGPGEARHADLGITGSGKNVIIFRKGEIIHKTTLEGAVDLFLEELEKL